MDYDPATKLLAIGMGDEVHLTREVEKSCVLNCQSSWYHSPHVFILDHYQGDTKLPSPRPRHDLEVVDTDTDRRLRAVAVHFGRHGRELVVSYLFHGIM